MIFVKNLAYGFVIALIVCVGGMCAWLGLEDARWFIGYGLWAIACGAGINTYVETGSFTGRIKQPDPPAITSTEAK